MMAQEVVPMVLSVNQIDTLLPLDLEITTPMFPWGEGAARFCILFIGSFFLGPPSQLAIADRNNAVDGRHAQ